MTTRLLVLIALVGAPVRAEQWFELQLIPVSAQINVLEVEHSGSGGRATFHFNRFLGVYVGGLANWHSTTSPWNGELYQTVLRVDVSQPTPVVSTWQLHAGLESIPLMGTFSIGSATGELGVVATLGLGPSGSRVRLGDPYSTGSVSYVDAGVRLMGHAGLGLRFALHRFAVHVGAHGSVWSNAVTALNSCSLDDARALDRALRSGLELSTVSVSAQCHFDSKLEVPLAVGALRNLDPKLNVSIAGELGVSWSW